MVNTKCIGFIGLGVMGSATAANLLRMGHKVHVYDIDTNKVKQMVELGAYAASSIADLASNSTCIVSMITGPQHAMEVYLGPNGVFKNLLQPQTFCMDCSTIGYHTAVKINKAAQESNQIFLDCPMSGGSMGAKNMTLTFMIGATDEEFEAASTFFKTFGKTIVHAGPSGMAQLIKICNNISFAINMLGTCESYTLAKSLGANISAFTDVLRNSSGNSYVINHYHPLPDLTESAPSNEDYINGYSTDLLVKDLSLAISMSKEAGKSLPILEHAVSIYKKAQSEGMGSRDFSVVMKSYA